MGSYSPAAPSIPSSPSPSTSKPSALSSTSLLPPISDAASARSAARQGVVAAVICAIVTAVFAALAAAGSGFAKNLGLDAWAFLDAAIFVAIAVGIWRMSRFAAMCGLLFYLLERVFAWVSQPTSAPKGLIVAVFLTLAFVNGVRGTFRFHRISSVQASLPPRQASPSPMPPLPPGLPPLLPPVPSLPLTPMLICAKCRTPVGGSDLECLCCGVIFSKAPPTYPTPPRPATTLPPPPPAAPLATSASSGLPTGRTVSARFPGWLLLLIPLLLVASPVLTFRTISALNRLPPFRTLPNAVALILGIILTIAAVRCVLSIVGGLALLIPTQATLRLARAAVASLAVLSVLAALAPSLLGSLPVDPDPQRFFHTSEAVYQYEYVFDRDTWHLVSAYSLLSNLVASLIWLLCYLYLSRSKRVAHAYRVQHAPLLR